MHGFECVQAGRGQAPLRYRYYQHPCGLRHLALQDAHSLPLLWLCLRTPPPNRQGLPHQLEHLVLTGSARYPALDPFFSLLRRSLAVDVNAITEADVTSYYAVSPAEPDVLGFLEVFVDACHQPLLRPALAERELWRVTDGQAGGVLYHEMRGAEGDPQTWMNRATNRLLLPGSPAQLDSGGESLAVLGTSLAQLRRFHARCYSAANAVVVSNGLSPAQVQKRLHAWCASGGQALPSSARARAPRLRRARIALPPEAPGCSLRLAWAWGHSADPLAALEGEFVLEALTGDAAAPLRAALEEDGRYQAFSADWRSEASDGLWICDGDLAHEEERPGIEALVKRLITEQTRQPQQRALRAALEALRLRRARHWHEHSHRCLLLAEQAALAWARGGEPSAWLQPAQLLEQQARHLQASFSARLAQIFLNNPRQLSLLGTPDPHWHTAQEQAHQQRLRSLARRADSAGPLPQDHRESLPLLPLAHVPRAQKDTLRWHQGRASVHLPQHPLLHAYAACYLPRIRAQDASALALLMDCAEDVGVGQDDHRAWAARLSDLGAQCDARLLWHGSGAWLLWEGQGPRERAQAWLELWQRWPQQLQLGDQKRIRQLLIDAYQDRLADLGDDPEPALGLACRGLSGRAGRRDASEGLALLHCLAAARSRAGTSALMARWQALHRRLKRARWSYGCVGDMALFPGLPQGQKPQAPPAPLWARACAVRPCHQRTAGSVFHCVGVLAVPTLAHPDAAALAIVAAALEQQGVHPRCREAGGAYGAEARYQPFDGILSLSTWRDPRQAATWQDFRAIIAELKAHPPRGEALHQARLAAIAAHDPPLSPTQRAQRAFRDSLMGLSPAQRLRFAHALRRTSADEVAQSAQRYLDLRGLRLASCGKALSRGSGSLG